VPHLIYDFSSEALLSELTYISTCNHCSFYTWLGLCIRNFFPNRGRTAVAGQFPPTDSDPNFSTAFRGNVSWATSGFKRFRLFSPSPNAEFYPQFFDTPSTASRLASRRVADFQPAHRIFNTSESAVPPQRTDSLVLGEKINKVPGVRTVASCHCPNPWLISCDPCRGLLVEAWSS
jgi:hypothetical protein